MHFGIRSVFTIVCSSNKRKGIRHYDCQNSRIKKISFSPNMLHIMTVCRPQSLIYAILKNILKKYLTAIEFYHESHRGHLNNIG